jgi:pimeloyl-ACP methyl ester carboxylesterase
MVDVLLEDQTYNQRPTGSRWKAALLLLGVSGCAWMYSAPAPLHTESYPASTAGPASTLLVLMPGRGDKATAFAEHGFVADLRAAGLAVDVVAVDARLGYYLKKTIVERMWTDVLAPARQRYKQIWILGVSMGGLGSLIVASKLPGAVDRVILLSPYLGPDSLVRDIQAAGGPARWTPTDLSDPFQLVWKWLQQYRQPGAPMPPMTLGFGSKESLAPGHRLLAQLLPADRVFEVEGGHNWVSWRQLWQREWAALAAGQ